MVREPEYAYAETRRVIYQCDDGNAQFVPVCPGCGRYVKSDAALRCGLANIRKIPNATCTKCGRITMPFEGWV